jgi:hypothetical protein
MVQGGLLRLVLPLPFCLARRSAVHFLEAAVAAFLARAETFLRSHVVRSNKSCDAAIVLQWASDDSQRWFIGRFWEKRFVAFSWMVSFAAIMSAEFGESPRPRTLAEQEQPR